MIFRSDVWRQLCITTAVLLIFAGLAGADWGRTVWSDDFQDGDFLLNPTWNTFAGPAGGTHTVPDMGGGDYGFRHTATYFGDPVYAGWAGAYVDVVEGDQGIEGWVDLSNVVANGWASMAILRYTGTTTGGFGTGYALAMTHNSSEEVTALLYRLDDGSATPITGEETILTTYNDVYFRFMATGTDADTVLQARVWPDATGVSEPTTWDLNLPLTSSPSYYNTGAGGVGVVTQVDGLTPDAYFDEVKYGTPEPTTMLLMASGIGALVLRRRRRND
jgi:hypothetical protein